MLIKTKYKFLCIVFIRNHQFEHRNRVAGWYSHKFWLLGVSNWTAVSIEWKAAATSSHDCCRLFGKLCSHQRSVSELVFVLSLASATVSRSWWRLQQARAVFVSENGQTENISPLNFIHFDKDLQTKSETRMLFGEAPPLESLLTYSWAISYFVTSQRWFWEANDTL